MSDEHDDAARDIKAETRTESAQANRYTPYLNGAKKVLRAVGRAGLWVGRKTADTYHAIDPDVRRQLAELPLIGLSTLGTRDVPIEALPADGYRPVLCVHGLGGHRNNFAFFRSFFSMCGRSRTYLLGLDPSASLEEMAAHFERTVRTVREVNGLAPDARIDVVAHSMGGLVARLALARFASLEAQIDSLVTMGTPHAGTHLARLASTHHTLALRPSSETLQALDAQVPWASSVRLVALWSPADIVLLPSSSAQLEGAKNVCAEGVTHTGYFMSTKVFALVWAELLASSGMPAR